MAKAKKFSYPVTTLIGSRVSNLIAICKSHKIGKEYLGKLTLTFVVSGILEIFNGYELLLKTKQIQEVKNDTPPIFIIGFWRSGTTLLHNLLCQDNEAAYTSTFHTVFPNLVLTQAKWLKPLANYIGPSKRPFDNVDMDMDFPQEEEFGLMNLQPHSIYKFFLFPNDFDQIIQNEVFTAELSDKEMKKWKKHYSNLLAKALINSKGTRFISKNPCNITRIKLLKEMYPGAKFIFIYRNPYKVVESFYRFILEVYPGVQLQGVPADFSRKNVARMYDLIMRSYLKEREYFSDSEIIEIRMEDFIADIKGNLQDLYDKFSLGNFGLVEKDIDAYLEKNKRLSNDKYNVQKETIDLVNQKFPDIVKILGYDIVTNVNDLDAPR